MNRKKIWLVAVIVLLGASFFYFDLGKYLTLTSLKSNRDALVEFYESHHLAMIAIFITFYIVQTALSLPGAAILSLAAGAVFGAVMGTLYVNIGATIGASLAFLVSRYLFRDMMQKKIGSRLEKVNGELERRGFNYLLFLRLVPVFPFFLINLGAGLTKMPLRAFFIRHHGWDYSGQFRVLQRRRQSCFDSESGRDCVSANACVFTLLGLFALVPVLYQ